MARYQKQSHFLDGAGNVLADGTISVYLAGYAGITPASIYVAETGGTAVNSVTSASDGSFSFWVDDADYDTNQLFDITLTKANYLTRTYFSVDIFRVHHSDIITKGPYVDIRKFGASTSVANNLSALIAAEAYAFAQGKNLYIPPGTFTYVTDLGSNKFRCRVGIRGEGPNVSILENTGTGDALDLGPAGYFSIWREFAVKGNSLSRDGITLYTTAGDNPAYSRFYAVTSYNHGADGFHHRMAWATKYIECKATDNLGLGFDFDTQAGDAGTHNGVSCVNCESRSNGGTGSVGTDYTKGGVRVRGGAGVYWMGGIIEGNNAWGFIVSEQGTEATRVIRVADTYFENNPNSSASSTVGGAIHTGGIWESVIVEHSWIGYGAKGGATGYAFYITAQAGINCCFEERNNFTVASGAGTNIRNYNNNNRFQWDKEYISRSFANDSSPVTLLTIPDSGIWQIGGFIYMKKDVDTVGGVYPFIVARDPAAAAGAKQVSVGTALGGLSATAAPTMAWATDDLQLTIAASHSAYVTLTLGGAQSRNSLPSSFTLNRLAFKSFNGDTHGTMFYQTDIDP